MSAELKEKADDGAASRWGLLVLLTIINVLNFVDRQLLPSFANFIKPELGLTDTQYGLLTGLFFAFGWEQFVMLVPGYLRRFSVAYYLQSLVPQAMPSQGVSSLLQSFFKDNPSIWTCLAGLAVILGVSLTLAARAVERREYVLEQ